MANQGYGNYETEADKPRPADAAKPERTDAKPKAAGPHAEPHLTNHVATPGAGAMPEGPAPGDDVDPGAG